MSRCANAKSQIPDYTQRYERHLPFDNVSEICDKQEEVLKTQTLVLLDASCQIQPEQREQGLLEEASEPAKIGRDMRGRKDRQKQTSRATRIYYISCSMPTRAHQSCLEGEAAEAVGEIPPSLNTWSDHQYKFSVQM